MTVIKTIAIVNSEGEIWNIYHPGASIIPEGEYEHDKTSTVVHITDVIDHSEFQQTNYYKVIEITLALEDTSYSL